ncbi:MAG: GNAT family N-acetyltransferase, partial [Sphaerochaetaceae bacterium]
IEPLEEGVGEVVIANDDGILVRIQDTTYAVVLFNPAEAEVFAREVRTCKGYIAVYDDSLVSSLKQQGFSVFLECIQAIYPSRQPFVLDDSIVIRPLEERDLSFVTQHYQYEEEPYILERILAGVMLGAEVEGNLAGFIGRHIDCSMGMLHVLPPYRRKHLGVTLEKACINQLLAQNTTPFCHVKVGNVASLSLQKKLGLVFSPKHVYWLN